MYTLIGEQNVMRVAKELDSICAYGKIAYPYVVNAYLATAVKTPFMLKAVMTTIPSCDTEIEVRLDDRMLCRLVTIYSYLENQNIPTSFVLLDTVTLAMLNRIRS